MKIWLHIVASLVGFAVAALVVYAVFGTASEQGATQEGSGPAAAAGGATSACGSMPLSQLSSSAARRKARDAQPALVGDQGPIAGIDPAYPDQQAWVDRVTAAGGFCIDELRLSKTQGAHVTFNTPASMSDSTVSAYALGVLREGFTSPFNFRKVVIDAGSTAAPRTIAITDRVWNSFLVQCRTLHVTPSVHALAQFQASRHPTGLRVVGWS